MATPPRILLVTDSCPNQAQGTGVALLRHFAEYPKDRLHSAYLDAGDPAPEAWRGDHFSLDEPFAILCRAVRLVSVDLRVRLRFAVVGRRWREAAHAIVDEFRPDVVYSIPFTENGLHLTRVFTRLVPQAPVVLHLFDWMPRTSERVANDLLREVAAKATRRWTLGENLTEHATRLTGLGFTTVPICSGALASRPACDSWVPGRPFRACVIGNIWSRSAFQRMCDAWETLQSRHPDLGPIEWAASPRTLAHGWKDVLQNPRVSRIIRHAGFLTGAALTNFLQGFHASFVPFATEHDENTPYALYSVPSRFAELACCGVPMVAITPPGTGFGRFLRSDGVEHILGSPAFTTTAIVDALEARIRDPESSARISRSLHAYAATHCDITRYREFLCRQLAAVAAGIPCEDGTARA